MPTYGRFEELPVWQQAKALAVAIYRTTGKAPFAKDFAFVRQIRRAGLSVPSNIAEGFERGTAKEFVHYLHIARGSCGEVRSQLAIATELEYVDQRTFDTLEQMCLQTARQLAGLIDYLKTQKPSGNSNPDQ